MTALEIIQLMSALLFLIASGFQIHEARNCRKARRQYQAMISVMMAKEDGVPFA